MTLVFDVTLDHEILYDSMEGGRFEAKALLPCAQGPKILSRLWEVI